jgi:hypothetical protein
MLITHEKRNEKMKLQRKINKIRSDNTVTYRKIVITLFQTSVFKNQAYKLPIDKDRA